MRELILSDIFYDYYQALPERVKEKFDYVMQILISQQIVSTKFIKHIENTKLYEMRVSVSHNEYRTLIFSLDNENLNNASKIVLLNAFLKKSTYFFEHKFGFSYTTFKFIGKNINKLIVS